MGFDVQTFTYILSSGFATHWDENPIPCNDTSALTNPRPERRSLDAAGALGLVLHYLNSTMREVNLQQIFALIPTTVSQYITFALRILLSTLQAIPEAKIKWPKENDFKTLSHLVLQRHSRLVGAFGSIDGLKLPVQTSDDIDIENATFNGWLLEHFISSVLVFSSKGNSNCLVVSLSLKFHLGVNIAARTNAPGSWHDSQVAQPIYNVLRNKTPDGYYIIADTAFPRGTAEINGRICAPLKDGQRVAGTPDQIMEAMAFN